MSKGTSMAWGPDVPKDNLAHSSDEMACFTCHLSWTTSCAGCHLPIEANQHTERHHYEGHTTRNFATYNPQVAREDMFQLGRHGSIKNNIIAPIASRSALVLSSTNNNRELKETYSHSAGRAQCIQLRGEYLYVSEGTSGMRVYDVASIANKGTSQRIITAPFSPLGQNTYIPSTNATCVALPTTQPIN